MFSVKNKGLLYDILYLPLSSSSPALLPPALLLTPPLLLPL
jgi:hypothetical protein